VIGRSRALPGRRLKGLASAFRRDGIGHLVARTAGYNVLSSAADDLGGIITTRAMGPRVQGEHAVVESFVVQDRYGRQAVAAFREGHPE
jgi:hypothetical protein